MLRVKIHNQEMIIYAPNSHYLHKAETTGDAMGDTHKHTNSRKF